MSKSERERALLRRLLAVAVERLGGELKVGPEDFAANYEMGMDHHSLPTVVTSYLLKPETPKK